MPRSFSNDVLFTPNNPTNNPTPPRPSHDAPTPHTWQPFGFPPDRAYIWGCVGFLWGALVLLTAGAAFALQYTQPPAPQPTVPEAEGRKEVQRRLFAGLQRQLKAQLVQPLIQAASFRRTPHTLVAEGGWLGVRLDGCLVLGR